MQFRYPDNELVVENTGHVIEVPIPADNGNTLKIGSSVYTLQQYHFHAPSEHTLNGQRYDLEAHLVHQNAAGQTAVVGVFMNIGDHPNELVDDVFKNAPDVAGEETDVGVESNAKELLPGFGSDHDNGTFVITRYYTYSGSLTTPPCSEAVRWIVAEGSGQRLRLLGRRDAPPGVALPGLRRVSQQQPAGATAQRSGNHKPGLKRGQRPAQRACSMCAVPNRIRSGKPARSDPVGRVGRVGLEPTT